MFLWKFRRVFGKFGKVFLKSGSPEEKLFRSPEVPKSGHYAGGCLGATARVPDDRSGGIPAAGTPRRGCCLGTVAMVPEVGAVAFLPPKPSEPASERILRVSIFFSGGRNAAAPTLVSIPFSAAGMPPPLIFSAEDQGQHRRSITG
jgi:hypothetical protein